MSARRLLPIVVLLLTMLPATASARGVRLHGLIVSGARPYTGMVGDCVCDDTQWYTVGLRAGTAVITGKLTTVDTQPQYSYGVDVFLMQGGQTVGQTQAACAAGHKPCNKPFRIDAHVARAGVFYVKVFGLGSEDIHYTLRVNGPIYHLACRKGYC